MHGIKHCPWGEKPIASSIHVMGVSFPSSSAVADTLHSQMPSMLPQRYCLPSSLQTSHSLRRHECGLWMGPAPTKAWCRFLIAVYGVEWLLCPRTLPLLPAARRTRAPKAMPTPNPYSLLHQKIHSNLWCGVMVTPALEQSAVCCSAHPPPPLSTGTGRSARCKPWDQEKRA